MAEVEFRLKLDLVDATWLTTNADGVPAANVPIFRTDGKYAFGDNVKKVSELTWFGTPVMGLRQVAFGHATTGELISSGNLLFYDGYLSLYQLDIGTYTRIGGGGTTSFVYGVAANFKVGHINDFGFTNYQNTGVNNYYAYNSHVFTGGPIQHRQLASEYHGFSVCENGGYEQGFFTGNAQAGEVRIGSQASYFTTLWGGGAEYVRLYKTSDVQRVQINGTLDFGYTVNGSVRLEGTTDLYLSSANTGSSKIIFRPAYIEALRLTVGTSMFSNKVRIGTLVDATHLFESVVQGSNTYAAGYFQNNSYNLGGNAPLQVNDGGAYPVAIGYSTTTINKIYPGGTELVIQNDGTGISTRAGYLQNYQNFNNIGKARFGVADLVGMVYTVEVVGDLRVTSLQGTGNRMVEADENGVTTAYSEIGDGDITDAALITLITTGGNWTGVNYTGAALTGIYKGQTYVDATYFYFADADDSIIRVARA